MKPHTLVTIGILAVTLVQIPLSGRCQGTPEIVWEAAAVSTLANSIQGVDWSPGVSNNVVFGSTDRWVRSRRADTGALVYSVLQPLHSDAADQTIYSADGTLIAVHNSKGGLGFRVYRAADSAFLGILNATVNENRLIRFSPDAQLLAAGGDDGTFSRWRMEGFTISLTLGSGYDKTNTTFNFSADGRFQSDATEGTITIRQRSNGEIVRILSAGLPQGAKSVTFTPDSTRIAAWSENPNEVILWRISDGVRLADFKGRATNEGVVAIRFTPDGTHLVTTGYLPYVGREGLWQQKGIIRFWRVSDGVVRQEYDERTGTAVTSPVAWSPDGTSFVFGTYEGSAIVARTPSMAQIKVNQTISLRMLADGNVLLSQFGAPEAHYHVQVTTNMVVWEDAGIISANANGYYEFLDTNACPVKVYRSWKAP